MHWQILFKIPHIKCQHHLPRCSHSDECRQTDWKGKGGCFSYFFASVPKKLHGQAINLIIHTSKLSSILKFCITITPYLTFFFKQTLIIFTQGCDEYYGCYIFKAIYPFLSFSSLPSYIYNSAIIIFTILIYTLQP